MRFRWLCPPLLLALLLGVALASPRQTPKTRPKPMKLTKIKSIKPSLMPEKIPSRELAKPKRGPIRNVVSAILKRVKGVAKATSLPKSCQAYSMVGLVSARLAYSYEKDNDDDKVTSLLYKHKDKYKLKGFPSLVVDKPVIFRKDGAQGNENLAVGLTCHYKGSTFRILSYKGSTSKANWKANGKVKLERAPKLCTRCKVHRGFYETFKLLRSPVRAWLKKSKTPVLYTGHSLGGALAVIAASEFARSYDCTITFGQPKAGNRHLNSKVASRLGGLSHTPGKKKKSAKSCARWLRFANKWDWVTKVPPLIGYSHNRGSRLFLGSGKKCGIKASDLWQCHDLDRYYDNIQSHPSVVKAMEPFLPDSENIRGAMGLWVPLFESDPARQQSFDGWTVGANKEVVV